VDDWPVYVGLTVAKDGPWTLIQRTITSPINSDRAFALGVMSFLVGTGRFNVDDASR
jgi:hypothetical protein